MRAIAGEEVAHDLLGPAHDAHDAGMAVDPFEQERLEACNVEGHRVREGNGGTAGIADVLWAFRRERAQTQTGLPDHVANEHGDHAPRHLVDAAAVVALVACGQRIGSSDACDRDAGEVRQADEAGTQTVVDVVADVGDVVGEGRNLCLGAGPA